MTVELTDAERLRLSTWDDGRYACPHDNDTCPTPNECAKRFGLTAEVESILSDRMTEVRRQLAEELLYTELPKDIQGTTRVLGWFVEGARWSASIIKGETA